MYIYASKYVCIYYNILGKFHEIISKYIISSQIGVDAYRKLIFNILLLSPFWSIVHQKMVEVVFSQIQMLKFRNVFLKNYLRFVRQVLYLESFLIGIGSILKMTMTRKSKVEILKCFLRKLGNSLSFCRPSAIFWVLFDRIWIISEDFITLTRKSKVEISKCFLRKLENQEIHYFFCRPSAIFWSFFDRNIADFGEQHVVLDFSHWKMSVISQYSALHNGFKTIYEEEFIFCAGGI